MPAYSPFRNTIRNKLMLLLLLATILPIASSMVISYNSTKRSISDETIEKNARLLSLGTTNLLNYVNNINQKSLAVYNSINVPRSLYYILEHNMEDEVFPNDLSDVIANRNLLKDHLYNIYQSVSEFNQVRLHVVKQKVTYILKNDSIKLENDASLTFSGALTKTFIEPSHLGSTFGVVSMSAGTREMVFTLHRPIFRAPSDELMAELAIDVRLNVLKDLTRQLYDDGKEKFMIVDAKKNIVLSSDPDATGRLETASWLPFILSDNRKDAEGGHFAWSDGRFSGHVFYDRAVTPFMDWYLVKLTPDSHLYSAADGIARINVWVAAGFLTVAVAATLLVSLLFTKPLLRLIGYVNQIERGNLNVDIDIRSQDEIGVLARRFRSMMQTINNLILKEYRLELANKTNQLKALQAQVNPHFLYNSLQSVGTVALQHKDQQIYSLITSLGKMMRYSMNTDESVVTLDKELDYLSAYLDLQKQRFDASLEVELDVDPAARTLQVPKMILQPLAENFFKHGFVPAEGQPAWLSVACRLDADRLLIRIEDNGKGMEPEALEALNRSIEAGESPGAGPDGGGIGLANVISRLRLHFHEDASMKLSAREPNGLEIRLEIPLDKEETAHESSDH
ncbi:cache domain-containing sensor histidine kinase [Cohnella candidum]|uniref:histidine kinase n=1 Tax=Cohnella candidum TaxID=2674991 RepID=A0A3G3JVI8_9BACL|nr:histidine kinase [Cohnella candidum]AYQ71867.1 HAMP domain-containing protein [Cohnella candidum]